MANTNSENELYFYFWLKISRFKSKAEISKILLQIIPLATTNEDIAQIQKFVEEIDLSSSETIKTALGNAKLDLQWADENIPIIKGIIEPIKKAIILPSLNWIGCTVK